jgi:hypothetical protein
VANGTSGPPSPCMLWEKGLDQVLAETGCGPGGTPSSGGQVRLGLPPKETRGRQCPLPC